MELPLQTSRVWQIEGEIAPLAFLRAASRLLEEGDVVVFGIYEPTAAMVEALAEAGAVRHHDLPEFLTAFDANRDEHPDGAAFQMSLPASGFSLLFALESAVLRQRDVPAFFDHFVAYRPAVPIVPLISFHDAFCGGTLYLSGDYPSSDARELAASTGCGLTRARNPVF